MSRYRKIGLVVMILGVVAGSVFTNMTYKANYYFLADLNMDLTAIKNMNQLSSAYYAVYILGKRLFQFFVLAVVFRFIVMEAIIAVAGFTGSFAFSVFITYQLLQAGMHGVAAVLTALCPQWLFYGLGIYWWIKGEEQRGKRESFRSYVIFACFMIIGILSEILLNPKLILL